MEAFAPRRWLKKLAKPGSQFWSWTALLSHVGLSTAPVYVKLDIEGYEFPVIYSMVEEMRRSKSMHMLPKQMMVEVHNRFGAN